jgi:hypothetical protein
MRLAMQPDLHAAVHPNTDSSRARGLGTSQLTHAMINSVRQAVKLQAGGALASFEMERHVGDHDPASEEQR